jgi:hypothetical protein
MVRMGKIGGSEEMEEMEEMEDVEEACFDTSASSVEPRLSNQRK